jgi:hypothetical protein
MQQILDKRKELYLVRMLPHNAVWADEHVTLMFPPTIMSNAPAESPRLALCHV